MNFCSEGITGNVSAYSIVVPQCSDGCHNGLWILSKIPAISRDPQLSLSADQLLGMDGKLG
jgi:hypothetical protein